MKKLTKFIFAVFFVFVGIPLLSSFSWAIPESEKVSVGFQIQENIDREILTSNPTQKSHVSRRLELSKLSSERQVQQKLRFMNAIIFQLGNFTLQRSKNYYFTHLIASSSARRLLFIWHLSLII